MKVRKVKRQDEELAEVFEFGEYFRVRWVGDGLNELVKEDFTSMNKAMLYCALREGLDFEDIEESDDGRCGICGKEAMGGTQVCVTSVVQQRVTVVGKIAHWGDIDNTETDKAFCSYCMKQLSEAEEDKITSMEVN